MYMCTPLSHAHIIIQCTKLLQLNSDSSIAHFIQSPLSFTLSTDKVAYDNNVTVTWAIPEDEATHKDWIGQFGLEIH